jgi:agmatinase
MHPTTLTTLPPEQAFLGLPPEEAVSYADADAVIIPFGYEGTVSYGHGTDKGPAAILQASAQVELFDEELWCEPYKNVGIVTLEEPQIPAKAEAALSLLEGITAKVLADGKFPLILGGEHAITAGAIRPFVEKYGKISILHFDAHADLRDGYDGEPYSHAAALRRCLDHEGVDKLVSVGIRNISGGEVPFLEANTDRVSIFWGKDIGTWTAEDVVRALGNNPVYITIDVDGFDSSVMPATGTPEPGGLFWPDVVKILRLASSRCKVVGADVVELAPIKGFHACDFLTAKLVYKILGYTLTGNRK